MIPPKEYILKVLGEIKDGSVRKQAARHFGCSERTLQKWMNCYEIKLRDYKPARTKRNGWGANKLDIFKAREIRKRFCDGEEVKELAKEFGVSFASVSRIIRNETYKDGIGIVSGHAQVNVVHNPSSSFTLNLKMQAGHTVS